MIAKPSIGNDAINWNHPHTDGLVLASVINNNGLVLNDLVCDNNISLIDTAYTNEGIEATVSGSYGLINNTNEKIFNDNVGTIIMYLKNYSSFDDSLRHNIFGVNFTGTSTPGIFIRKDANNVVNLYSSCSTHYNALTVKEENFPNWETGNQIAFQWDKNNYIFDDKELAINVDGFYVYPRLSVVITPWTNFIFPQNVGFLNQYTDDTNPFDGECKYLYIYDRILTADELSSIYLNPYAMFYKPNMLCNLFGAYSSSIIAKKNKILWCKCCTDWNRIINYVR